jgi:polysaccharide chain length determinant protein (PEP-CTERM system associated)
MPVNQLVNQVLDEVRGSWRFRWYAVALATAVAVAGWLLVFSLPDWYQADASVFVDTRTPLKPVLQGLTVEQDVDSQVNFVRQSLLAGPQLQHVAHEAGVLPPYQIDPRLQEQLLAGMGSRIDISVQSANGRDEDIRTAGSVYRIVYTDRNRPRALRVVKTLLDTFVNETLGGKREGSENAQQFLETQLQDYEKRLRSAEDRLAQFKSQHIGLMPSEQGGYFGELQKEQNRVSDLKTKLAEAQSRHATLMRQLRGDVAVAASTATDAARGSASGGGDTLSRIDEAQSHLDDLLQRFTDQHPDVIAARQTLEHLKQKRAAEIEGLKHGDAAAAAASRASSNPVYQSVQLALNQVDVEIGDLNTELEQHQLKVAELRRVVDTAPQVEAEFAQLNRDYDVTKAQYTGLLANLQKARLGERADSAGSVRFDIVQPPMAPLHPKWPRRPLLLAQVLVAALGAGGALAYGLHYLRPVVTSATSLAQGVGVPLLGLVSVAFPSRRRVARRRDVLRISLAGGCLCVAFVVLVIMSGHGYRLSLSALKHLVGS